MTTKATQFITSWPTLILSHVAIAWVVVNIPEGINFWAVGAVVLFGLVAGGFILEGVETAPGYEGVLLGLLAFVWFILSAPVKIVGAPLSIIFMIAKDSFILAFLITFACIYCFVPCLGVVLYLIGEVFPALFY